MTTEPELPKTGEPIMTRVLLRSGAAYSMIDEHLADQLKLSTWDQCVPPHAFLPVGPTPLVPAPLTNQAGIIYLWDKSDKPTAVQVAIAKHLGPPRDHPALPSDIREMIIHRFADQLADPISVDDKVKTIDIHFQIGCDLFLNFFDFQEPSVSVKHGLKMLPTCLGYVMVGQIPASAWHNEDPEASGSVE